MVGDCLIPYTVCGDWTRVSICLAVFFLMDGWCNLDLDPSCVVSNGLVSILHPLAESPD